MVGEVVKPPNVRPRTYAVYKANIKARLKPNLGALRLQAPQAADLENHYALQTDLARVSLQLHHSILSSALESAVKN